MPTASLTDRRVRTLRPSGADRIELWDALVRGFGIRATVQTKSWFVMYRLAGRQRRMTLGTFPLMSLREARRAAADALMKVRNRIDPQDEREAAERRLRQSRANSFTAVAAQFMDSYVRAKRQLRTADEIQAMLDSDVLPDWGGRPIDSITKGDVRSLLRKVANRGAAHRANKHLAVVRKLFNWALEEDIVAVSPCHGVRPVVDQVERDRVLSDDEVTAIWSACKQTAYPFGPLFQFLLLTGQRRGETAAICWSEIDLARAVWTIPAEKAKGKRIHLVPLAPMVVNLLLSLPRKDDIDLIFTTTGKTPASGFSKAKAELDTLVQIQLRNRAIERGDAPEWVKPMPEWRLHDLRRTMATNLGRLKIPRLHITKVLNHADAGVTPVYDRFEYFDEKRHALETWAQFLDGLVNPQQARIVSLRPARSG
jgi:integrase